MTKLYLNKSYETALKLLPLNLKDFYLTCKPKPCCIQDTSSSATEALGSPPISMAPVSGGKRE